MYKANTTSRRCLGLAVGKCNCGACLTFVHCVSDQQCGGLAGACTEKGYCDCARGFKQAGYDNAFDAFVKLCNVKECIPDTPSCHGLPCNAGLCACPI
ncbi:unnamed protein product [Gongylonema pulchrum]|uniref:CC domain-containing protein n=1 Tax=Gongylonema pulchrum TaxID=637853 RepID=A0A183CYI1_9BILA|nr:unnamed protein product [Gongylonema pulchrum]